MGPGLGGALMKSRGLGPGARQATLSSPKAEGSSSALSSEEGVPHPIMHPAHLQGLG